MPALQEFHDSTLYLIRAETAVNPFSLVPRLCRGMPTGGSVSTVFTVFTVFEAEPQSPIPSRSLGTSLTVRYAVANAPYKSSTNQQLP